MVDILAIVSRAVFEDQALRFGELVGVGDVWDTDRYVSKHRAFEKLREGGRIFLVTVRPDEHLWLVGVLDAPLFDGTEWIARTPNQLPVANITALRSSITFAKGTGIAAGYGAMAMSLQTPRALSPASAEAILAVASGGKKPLPPIAQAERAPPVAAPVPKPEKTADKEAPAIAELTPERHAAIDVAVERFVVLADKMQEAYGLRLPEELAYAAGWMLGLGPAEREDVERFVGTFSGVGSWFVDPALNRPPSGDERLRDRMPSDPPEFVPVFTCEDGERWGLWYDDPEELPAGVAHRVRSNEDDAPETRFYRSSLLIALRDRLDASKSSYRAELLGVIGEVRRREAANVNERTTLSKPGKHAMVGSTIEPRQPDWIPQELDRPLRQRRAAYASGSSDVDTWIEHARSELSDGATARALILGHELHHVQAPKWRLAATELLVRAYTILGRRPLADLVRAVYLHQDPTEPVYEIPRPHPVRTAAISGDIEAIVAALDEGAPTVHDLEDALTSATTKKAIDAIIDHPIYADFAGERSPIAVALRRQLRAMEKARDQRSQARHRTLAVHLMERGGVSARAFASVQSISIYSNEDVFASAAAFADVASTFNGSTPLHLAASAARSASVKILLERGADVNAKNADGKTAYDLARDALAENPGSFEVSEALVHLQRAGAGPQKPPPPKDDEIEFAEGDAVHHKKLGDGIVQTVTGEGEEAKLLIRFATETRTFLAKFVTPRP